MTKPGTLELVSILREKEAATRKAQKAALKAEKEEHVARKRLQDHDTLLNLKRRKDGTTYLAKPYGSRADEESLAENEKRRERAKRLGEYSKEYRWLGYITKHSAQ
jgi:actin-related protein